MLTSLARQLRAPVARSMSTLPDRYESGDGLIPKHVEERLAALPFKQGQRLQVHEGLSRNSLSGIKATVFGGTATVGMMAGNLLTGMGSQVIYPYRYEQTFFHKRFNELKVVADLGDKYMLKLEDFTDPRELKLAISNSNTVVCTIGSKIFEESEPRFRESDYQVPVAIAKAIADSPTVQRAIFIGHSGADPFSPSRARRYKYMMEQEVRRILPWATILRPTRLYDTYTPRNSWAGKFAFQLKNLTRKIYATRHLNAQTQPVYANDVALAIFHAIKFDETMGKSYDLGGPTEYTMQEILEMQFNVINVKPHVIPTSLAEMFQMKQMPLLAPRRFFHKYYLGPEWVIDESIPDKVQPWAYTFDDLKIKPISFGFKVAHANQELYYALNNYQWTQRDLPSG